MVWRKFTRSPALFNPQTWRSRAAAQTERRVAHAAEEKPGCARLHSKNTNPKQHVAFKSPGQ
jgi:hypothetical protein